MWWIEFDREVIFAILCLHLCLAIVAPKLFITQASTDPATLEPCPCITS